MGIFFYVLNLMNWFRMDPLEEEIGMDISRHKGAAYDISPANETCVEELIQRRSDHGSRHSKKNGLSKLELPKSLQDAPKEDLPKEDLPKEEA